MAGRMNAATQVPITPATRTVAHPAPLVRLIPKNAPARSARTTNRYVCENVAHNASARGQVAAAVQQNAMGHHRWCDGLDIVGCDEIATMKCSVCLSCTNKRKATAGALAEPHLLMSPRGDADLHDVVGDRRRNVNLANEASYALKFGRIDDGRNLAKLLFATAAKQQIAFGVGRKVAHLKHKHESVTLTFDQRKGSRVIEWVLCGNDEERFGQLVRRAIDRDGALGHCFEQGRLRAWSCAVEFVDQHHVREQRAGTKLPVA
jgi:hypothetical protein